MINIKKRLTIRFSSVGWIKKVDYSIEDKLNYVFGNDYVIKDDPLYCGDAIKIYNKKHPMISRTILRSTVWEFNIETLFKIKENLDLIIKRSCEVILK